jgi:hypothetical protein
MALVLQHLPSSKILLDRFSIHLYWNLSISQHHKKPSQIQCYNSHLIVLCKYLCQQSNKIQLDMLFRCSKMYLGNSCRLYMSLLLRLGLLSKFRRL